VSIASEFLEFLDDFLDTHSMEFLGGISKFLANFWTPIELENGIGLGGEVVDSHSSGNRQRATGIPPARIRDKGPAWYRPIASGPP